MQADHLIRARATDHPDRIVSHDLMGVRPEFDFQIVTLNRHVSGMNVQTHDQADPRKPSEDHGPSSHERGPSTSASTNSRARNSCKSSSRSPTPRNRTGIANSSAMATTTPPFAVPSNFVSANPVTPMLS